jgi:hypothetical protein
VENQPCWFVIDRKGTLTYAAQPTFASPTSYVQDVDRMLEALKKAARQGHVPVKPPGRPSSPGGGASGGK